MSAEAPIAEAVALGMFARATLDVLTFWPALRIAVQQGWGGPSGVTHLAEDIVDAFYSAAVSAHPDNGPPPVPSADHCIVPETDDIEDVLLHVLSHEFNINLEDGSERIIARDLVTLWRECIHRAVTAPPHASGAIEKFAAAAAKAKAEDGQRTYAAQREGDSEDDEEDSASDDEMDEDDDVEMGESEHVHGPGCSHSHPPPRRQEPEIDEDGFQMVPKKGGRR